MARLCILYLQGSKKKGARKYKSQLDTVVREGLCFGHGVDVSDSDAVS